ncbi:hypothetical protein ACFYY8_40795 [Streptosporangium sp. NPDC001559]|uniref:hypothetical protein n=1 Tax=Streptosporangium sp. NPDC001559 TaxID=3366187 RepID=UPI0036EAC75F
MRQTWGFVVVWCAATVLAAGITWLGVRDVLTSQVFDDARVESLDAELSRIGAVAIPSKPPTGTAGVTGPPSSSPQGRHTPGTYVSPLGRRGTSQPRATGLPRGDRKGSVGSRRISGHERQPDDSPSKPSATGTPTKPPAKAPTKAPTATPEPEKASATPSPTPHLAAEGGTKTVSSKNGSVAFSIEGGVCRVVSANPNPGYEAKVTQAEGWIRVDLVQGDHGSAIYCVGGESRTDVWEY